MPTFELEDSTFAGYIPDDEIMVATVAGVKLEEKPYTDDEGKNVVKVVFRFLLVDPDGPHDGVSLKGETATRFNINPECKLRNWSCAILGQDLPVGYRLDTDILVGHQVRVVIGWKEYPDKDNPEKMKQWNSVKDVMPTSEAMDRMVAAGVDEEPF